MSVAALEFRRYPRLLCERMGSVESTTGAPARRCTIVNLSEGGARLTFADAEAVPDQFTLRFLIRDNVRFPCKVVWRGEDEIGIEFL
jgi:hypothetical protein